MLKSLVLNSYTDQIIADWKNLWEMSPAANMVNSPEWFLSAQKAFGERKASIVLVYEGDQNKLLAIAAFVREKVFGIPVWTTPGREFADKNSILVDFKNQDIMRLLFGEIAKLGPVYLVEYEKKQLEEIKKYTKNVTAWKNDVNPYIDFSKGKYGDFPNRRRNNLISRLESGEIECKLETTTAENSREAIEKCFTIDTISAKQAHGKGIFYRQDARVFYRSLVEMSPSYVPISLLYFGDKPVSYLLGFKVREVYQAAQKAFVRGYEYYNPGKLLMVKLIDHYREEENVKIELGRGYDRFKRDFAHDFVELHNLIIANNPAIRLYFSSFARTRMKIYDLLYKHTYLYRLYTRLRDLLTGASRR